MHSVFRVAKCLGLCALAGMLLAVPVPAQNPPEPSTWITPEKITDTGLHLPSYMETVAEQMDYQRGLPTHEELAIQWDSLPGVSGQIVKKQDVENLPMSANFLVVERKHGIRGGAHTEPPMLVGGELVAAAATSGGEIRGLVVFWDPRASHTEDVAHGQRSDFVKPRVTFSLFIPDDPQIRRIVFFKPVSTTGRDAKLEKIGEIPLADDRGTPGIPSH